MLQNFFFQFFIICPMVKRSSDDTTYRLSYYESCHSPVDSYAPIREYIKPDLPFEKHTVYRLSYWPNDTPMKEKSWSPKQEYLPPVVPIDGCTTYRLSYYPHDGKKPLPIYPQPNENILNLGCCSDSNTTYRLSYFGCEDGRREPILPRGNITFSSCPPAYDTIHRMSFLGNWDVKPETPITPCSRQMLGRGPIQDVTTQKHDYTWKLLQLEPGIKPKDNLVPACAPAECCTTHRMSYLPNEPLRPVESYAPIRVYRPPDVPMNGETIMNLSYQPVDANLVEKRSSFVPYETPAIPLDGHTTYNTSYIPPGKFVPCCVDTSQSCQPPAQCCT